MPQIVLPANFSPRKYQRGAMAYLDNGGKRAVICMHRRAGKDRLMLAQASKMAFRRVGLYWHMLPTLKQARKAVWDAITGDGLKLLEATFPAPLVKRKRDDEMLLELVNGSIIQLVGSDNFDSLVGANPVHITFSEAALAHPRAWELMRPILAENGGSVAFISTPRGYNHFHRLMEIAKADPAWFWAHMGVLETGRMTREDVEAEIRAGMPEELARQEFYCDFAAANVGSILGSRLEQADREGRITDDVQYDKHSPAPELIFDIGHNDATAVWIIQRRPDGIAVLGYMEETGTDAQDWIASLTEEGYTPGTVGRIWLPHDGWAKTFATKRSVAEQFLAEKYKVARVPNLSKQDQINAARVAMRDCWFAKTATAKGRETLREWQFKYDEERRIFSREPEHNWASHCGDSFAYMAIVARSTPAPERQPDRPLAVPAHQSFALNDLWSTAPTASRRV